MAAFVVDALALHIDLKRDSAVSIRSPAIPEVKLTVHPLF